MRLWATAILSAGILTGMAGNGLRAQSTAAPSEPTQDAALLLLERARAEQAHGRTDLAIQDWQQVLLGEPQNATALDALARAARAVGDTGLAESYEQRLHQVGGSSAKAIPAPKTALTQAQTAQLAQAAKLADEGKYAAAMTIYRKLFGLRPPAEWAIVYYEAAAATDGGRPDAIEGLRALVAKYPDQGRYQISLGRVLTYDPATREEGRGYLAKFPQDAQAMQATRQSLLWDAAIPAMRPQILAYLEKHPDPQLDAVFKATQPAVQASVAPAHATNASAPTPPNASVAMPVTARQPSPLANVSGSISPSLKTPPTAGGISAESALTARAAPTEAPSGFPLAAVSDTSSTSNRPPSSGISEDASSERARTAAEMAAYQSLNASRIAEAETRFKAILTSRPQDEKALAGMGYVRMQQGNFLGAISYLEQAKRIDAEDKGLLAALDAARFCSIMGEGHDALSTNDLTTAEKRYREALGLRPNNAEALVGLAGTLLKSQQVAPAIPLFEHAVTAQPTSSDGWRGLFMAQLRNDQVPLALATFKRIPDAPRAQLMNDPFFLQLLSSAYSEVGRASDAQETLEAALKRPFAPDQKDLKANIQADLAASLSSANQLEQALTTYKQVLVANPGDAAAWQGLVRLQHSMGRDQDAQATLQSMPKAIYTNAAREPEFEITVAAIYQSLKKLDLAQELLQKMVTDETNAGQRPSLAIQMQLADIYVERGNPQLAYPVYQQVLRENPNRADAWAGLLSALHLTGHDKEAVAQLDLIPAAPHAQLQRNPAFLQTMAAIYANLGQPQEAAQTLSQVDQDNAAQHSLSADAEIQKAWFLYNEADDAGLYRQLMALGGQSDLSSDERRTIQTIWTNWATRRAVQASSDGNARRALAILNAAARAFPDNPAAIKLLAVGYAQAGDPHQAVLIYKSQNMASASSADYQCAVTAALAEGDAKDAEIWLRYALAAYPSDPQVLILAARFEQSRGDTARAIKYYHASLKAMPPVKPASELASELGLPAPSAPLSLPSPQQPQDLSVLLAPGYAEPEPADHPYLPAYDKSRPLPPYDGTTQLIPPYLAHPDASRGNPSGTEPSLAQADQAPKHAAAEGQAASAKSEVYSPYVAYVAPPTTGYRGNPTSAVSVQLGNDTPRPEKPQADVTDVLPTERYGPSARANQAAASRADVAAARAERIRRLQAESAAARSGQAHPPPEETMTGVMQSAQYTTQAKAPQSSTLPGHQLGGIPDTGAQQYPQPRTPPSEETTITHTRPVEPPPVRRAPARSPAPARSAPPLTPPPAQVAAPAVPVAPFTAPPSTVQSAAASSPAIPEGDAPIGAAYPLAAPPTDARLRSRDLPALGGIYNAQVPIPQTQRQQAEDELAALEGSYSGWVGITGIGRYRSGTGGVDRLYDFEVPTEASAVVGRSLRLTAVAEPVFLNSGVLSSSSFGSGNAPYVGTTAANAANPPAQQFSNGIGGELQLAGKQLSVAVGYTPYEFLVRNFTGRFLLNTLGNHLSVYGDRQPVKDTQLSYAGLYDPGTTTTLSEGPIWGGVVSSTGGVRLQLGDAAANFFVSGEGGILTGQHVLDNYRFKGALGAMFRVKNWRDTGHLTFGGTLSGMHYQHDEVGLSYGQGGYFSPSSYFLVAAPIKLEGRYGSNFHYFIAGSAGVRTFQLDAAPFYPLDPGLETNLIVSRGAACTSALSATYACGEYSQTVSTLFNYTFNSEVSYRFTDHWYGGGFALANNSNNFDTVSAGFFFRFVFRPQHSPQGYPAGLFQLDGIRALQIP
jgi:tetratricopeptide (TPR) repeat protein